MKMVDDDILDIDDFIYIFRFRFPDKSSLIIKDILSHPKLKSWIPFYRLP